MIPLPVTSGECFKNDVTKSLDLWFDCYCYDLLYAAVFVVIVAHVTVSRCHDY